MSVNVEVQWRLHGPLLLFSSSRLPGIIWQCAIATGVAMTLKHVVDHLSKGAVDPADRPVNGDDSDEDVLAL